MSAPGKPSPFYWLSFIPALAYWWLEENTDLQTALLGGLGLAVLEIIVEKYFSGKIHTLSKLNFGLIIVLGGLSLLASEGVWFKLQPTFTGVILGSWLAWNLFHGKSFLEEAMKDMGRPWPLPHETLLSFERDMCLFMFSYGLFMSYWAIYGTTSQWAFWKTGGQYLAFGVFMAVEFFLLRLKIKRQAKK